MPNQLSIVNVCSESSGKLLNREWIDVSNGGETPFNMTGCTIAVGKGAQARPRAITTLKAGITLKPGETVRLISGAAGKKSFGDPPEETQGLRNVYLFLKASYLSRQGSVVHILMGQREICRAEVTAFQEG